MFGQSAAADVATVTIDDIVYEIHADEGYVVAKDYLYRLPYYPERPDSGIKDYVILDSVNNLPVTIIADEFGCSRTGFIGEPMYLTSGKVKLPSRLKRLGSLGFNRFMTIDGDTLPSTLTSIGHNALGNSQRSTLLKIGKLPAGLKELGAYALSGCEMNGVVDLSSVDMAEIPAGLFCNASVGSLVLPSGIKSVGNLCFKGAYIGSVELPEKLKYIGEDALRDARISHVKWPDAVDSIGKNAFQGLKLYNDGVLDMSGMNIKVLEPGSLSGSLCGKLILPSGVTVIKPRSFAYAEIAEVVLPESLDSIMAQGFYESSIRRIEIPANVKFIGKEAFAYSAIENVKVASNLTSLPESMFANCTKLQQLVFAPQPSYTSIGTSAFSGCSSLTSIGTLPESLISIGASAFSGCSSLDSLDLDKCTSLHKLEYSVFSGSGLKSVTLPESIDSIGQYCFKGCKNLQEVVMGSNVQWIGNYAFECDNLRKVVCYAPIPPALDVTIQRNSTFTRSTCEYGSLYVPRDSYEQYAAQQNRDYATWHGLWGDFKSIVWFDHTHLSGIDGVETDADTDDEPVSVYNISGVQVWQGLRGEMPVLSPGIYVVRGAASARKIVVR